jgi:glycosyltransferase involved in cell wall biosynthesis
MTSITSIIPAYNAAAYLREAVDSALAQVGVSQEVIVVDDGSTDATPQIIADYGDRIRSIMQPNAGHVAARNRAATIAQGEWLAFLDADDCWAPTKLAAQLAAADDAALVYTERLNIGATSRVAARQGDFSRLPAGEVFEELLEGNFITVSSVLMRREWFERLGGFSAEPTGCEDWDLWLRCAAAGGRVAVVREPLTMYRLHPQSMTSNQALMCRGRLKAVERAIATPRGQSLGQRLANRARALAWSCSAWHAMATWRWKPLLWYMKSAAYNPWNFDTYKSMVKCMLRRL